jgi:hypothetical protein
MALLLSAVPLSLALACPELLAAVKVDSLTPFSQHAERISCKKAVGYPLARHVTGKVIAPRVPFELPAKVTRLTRWSPPPETPANTTAP